MWVIAGLGNPGDKYAATRHNIGFMVVDRISAAHDVSFTVKDDYSLGKGAIDHVNVTLLKPLTFMNLSGSAVKKVLKKSNLLRDGEINNLIVIHDDLDLEPGVVKIRRSGSSGGHRGVESIIRETGCSDFIRVKIGIGRESGVPAEEFVLRRFNPAEKKLVDDGILKAMKAVETIVVSGPEKAMNIFNRTPKAEQKPTE
jgi:PTH1 family peptidyl-tRNA hydrolase